MITETTNGKLVRIDQIDFPSDYERKPDRVEDDKLLQSIDKSGVQQSVVVLANDAGRFTLVKGGRRIRASEELGLNTVPAVIKKLPAGADEKKYRNRLRFILTQARQNLLPSQRADFIRQLMARFGMKQKDVAAYLGVDAGSITNWMAIERYHPDIVRLIDRNEINLHAARSFDGMKPDVQPRVYRELKREFRSMAGGKLHKIVRAKFSPKKAPQFYTEPEKTIEKLARKQKGRRSKRRPLSRDEKDILARDVTLKEVELRDSTDELKQLKREIALATIPVRAIMRDPELVLMLPPGVQPEFERFVEIYG